MLWSYLVLPGSRPAADISFSLHVPKLVNGPSQHPVALCSSEQGGTSLALSSGDHTGCSVGWWAKWEARPGPLPCHEPLPPRVGSMYPECSQAEGQEALLITPSNVQALLMAIKEPPRLSPGCCLGCGRGCGELLSVPREASMRPGEAMPWPKGRPDCGTLCPSLQGPVLRPN